MKKPVMQGERRSGPIVADHGLEVRASIGWLPGHGNVVFAGYGGAKVLWHRRHGICGMSFRVGAAYKTLLFRPEAGRYFSGLK
jgi:hypothetical protein